MGSRISLGGQRLVVSRLLLVRLLLVILLLRGILVLFRRRLMLLRGGSPRLSWFLKGGCQFERLGAVMVVCVLNIQVQAQRICISHMVSFVLHRDILPLL
jgi:hypothetical protein